MPETWQSLLGMLAAVLAVLALAYCFTRFVGSQGLRGAARPRGGRLRVLERLPLGKEQQLAVVELGERCLLLGVTAAGITVLAELTPEERALWQAQPQGAQGQPASFKEALKTTLDQRFGKR